MLSGGEGRDRLPQADGPGPRGRILLAGGPNCFSGPFPLLLSWATVSCFLLEPAAPPPTLPHVSMRKWSHSDTKPHRCQLHTLPAAPARSALPHILKANHCCPTESRLSWAPHGGWAPTLLPLSSSPVIHQESSHCSSIQSLWCPPFLCSPSQQTLWKAVSTCCCLHLCAPRLSGTLSSLDLTPPPAPRGLVKVANPHAKSSGRSSVLRACDPLAALSQALHPLLLETFSSPDLQAPTLSFSQLRWLLFPVFCWRKCSPPPLSFRLLLSASQLVPAALALNAPYTLTTPTVCVSSLGLSLELHSVMGLATAAPAPTPGCPRATSDPTGSTCNSPSLPPDLSPHSLGWPFRLSRGSPLLLSFTPQPQLTSRAGHL